MTISLLGKHSPTYILDKQNIEDIEKVLLDENNCLKIVSYDKLKGFKPEQIAQFCVAYGFYSIPTLELVEFLKEEIGNDVLRTIEIASGNGVLAKTLGIKATDNFMQEQEDIKGLYEDLKQAIVPYGTHVEKIDGNDAVRKFKPAVVIASWCTHKYNPKEHWRGGNAYGVNEKLIIERVDKYIHIGNLDTHKHKPALTKKHRIVKAEWLVSRSLTPHNNAIIIWD